MSLDAHCDSKDETDRGKSHVATCGTSYVYGYKIRVAHSCSVSTEKKADLETQYKVGHVIKHYFLCHAICFLEIPILSFSRLLQNSWRDRERFMSQGEYLSVTDLLVLLWWQVSPSPPCSLSCPALINSLCLTKWGLEKAFVA